MSPATAIPIKDIIARTGGRVAGNAAVSGVITALSIDSRDCAAGSLFIALPGTTADGHDYVAAAAAAGASAALVTHAVDDVAESCVQIIVNNSLQAVSDLAVMARLDQQMAGGYLVGITGSVGKTGSKEMLAHILQNMTGCHANKSSFNNHIGVPLTIAALPVDMPVAVQEMGMNAPGEIADLTLIAAPDVTLITRIADSHAGFFTDISEIAAAKAEIFDGLVPGGVAVLNRDDAFYDDLARRARLAGAGRIISFGRHDEAEFRLVTTTRLTDSTDAGGGMGIECDIAGAPLAFTLGMRGAHWAMNAMGILAVIDALGLDAREAAAHLADFRDLAGRGKVSRGRFGAGQVRLIDDSYNAGPASMAAGLQGLADDGADVLVLSDMLELGDGTAAAHAALAPLIDQLSPRHIIAMGPHMQKMAASLAPAIARHMAQDSDDAVAHLTHIARDGDVIFVKGSLGSGSWRVAKAILTTFAHPDADNQHANKGETPHAA